MVTQLLEKGADIEATDNKYGQTALLFALENGQQAVVEQLLRNNANVNAKDKCGATPLLLAAEQGHEDIVQ